MIEYVSQLKKGLSVSMNPQGQSMTPIINSGDTVVVVPYKANEHVLNVNDVVLCKVKDSLLLHKVTAIKPTPKGNRIQISNNHGYVNGWIAPSKVYGVVTSIKHN